MITYNDIYSFIVHSYMDTVKTGTFPTVRDWMHFIATDEYYYYTMF